MNFIKRNFLALMLAMSSAGMLVAADYGLPASIQEGNILHCFDWTMAEVKAELPAIAEAGFGAVQLSPLQRPDAGPGSPWHDLYRPYDIAFKSSRMGSADDLKALCEEAATYGIKIIVDVVANHVDKTAGYHDTWWDSNGRVRWNGGINYGDRNSITHNQLGDYGDINSEDAEVIARAKAYVQQLHDLGVKGIRWDAAKHIALPSENCGFWTAVTSVEGMYHYGEILDSPGPDASIIKEYTTFMSVTDNKYSNGAARENGGIPFGYGGDHTVNQGCPDTRMVYWAESHDTYANGEWSQNVSQSVIDRAYASFACRNGATALYLARPNTTGFNNIKVGKGSTAFTGKAVAEVNKFRNAMVGRPDWCEVGSNTFTVTRKGGGAVVVCKTSGSVSVKNGGEYCPAGTYTDRVSGNKFTVTSSTISGTVGSTGIAVLYSDGTPGPDPDPDPDPEPETVTIYYDNSVTSWANVNIHYWSSPSTSWPGVAMTKVEGNIWKYTFPRDPSGLKGFLFCDGLKSGDNGQTGDVSGAPANGHLYKGAGGPKGKVTDEGVYEAGPVKPVVKANPASGKRFAETLKVTLTVEPATAIHYTLDGTTPDASSTTYSQPIELTETTTITTYVANEAGSNVQTFTYTRAEAPQPQPGNSLNTDYYKVNPDGKVGSNRTVNMTFSKVQNDNRMCIAPNALSNWTDDDLIAQGVARDIAGAIKGKHEYPVVDSYAVYAAYDKDNLYLGVQYVYTVWDLYGTSGILTNGAAKPYQMDGRLMIAFDLDPYKSMTGKLTGGYTIWDDGDRIATNTFDNGTDCIWVGSTKSTVGTPGLFFPDENGATSYSAPYCVSIDAPFYGCQDGLLPSIKHIWGQKDFEYDPMILQTNDNFVDLIGEVPTNQHTFYEWKFPLSKLGITEDYIKNTGIGVMVIDTYGQGATGSTPYDPTCFDNATTPYHGDDSSSAEKNDEDCFTYKHARIGKLSTSGGVENVNAAVAESDAPVEYYNLQGVRVDNPQPGIYIRRQGSKVSKVLLK
jgi:alpha-amylase